MNRKITARGHTLLEVVFAVSILVVLAFLLWRLVDVSNDYKHQDDVIEKIDNELSCIQNIIKKDLSLMVFLKKQCPVFEIKVKEDGRGYIMSFFTTNTQENLTVAVQYDVQVIDYAKIQLCRIEVAPEQSLIMQQDFVNDGSLASMFDLVNDEFKTVRKFGVYLSGCVIRPSVRIKSNHVVAPARVVNGDIVCRNGKLFYSHAGYDYRVVKEVSFFDVSLRALTQFDQKKAAKMYRNNDDHVNDFVIKRSRRSFLRIVPMSSCIW